MNTLNNKTLRLNPQTLWLRRMVTVANIVVAMTLLGVGTAGAQPAESQQIASTYPNVSSAASADGQWRATLDANTYNFVAAKSIGATVSVKHREWACTGVFCWGGHSWQWVTRAASRVDISNVYTPYPPQYGNCDPANPTKCMPPAPPRRCAATNVASLDCYDWAFFITFSPYPGTPGAPLNIKGVRSTAAVTLPSGEQISLGAVDDEFWF